MRAYKRLGKEGFTLVELMIVVAIIGVLAALAIYGVNKYLASAKTSEAKNTIGAITRGAVAAFNRETYANAMLADGATSAQAMNVLCKSAAARVAPATPIGTKYQPSTAAGADFNAGDAVTGWVCLQFTMTEPTYFSYAYVAGAGTVTGSGATATGFEVSAVGDLNGNAAGAVTCGATTSCFARGADIRNGQIVLSTTLFTSNETE